MKNFPPYLNRLSDSDKRQLKSCMKRPIVIQAMKMEEAFRVNTPQGVVIQAAAGDYLMRGVEDELYHCPASVFEKSYDWVEQCHDGGT